MTYKLKILSANLVITYDDGVGFLCQLQHTDIFRSYEVIIVHKLHTLPKPNILFINPIILFLNKIITKIWEFCTRCRINNRRGK